MTQPMEPVTKRHTLSTGLTLVADHWGVPNDDPVVFLHGGGQTRHSWGGAALALASRGRYAVSLDLRGHGESEWADDGNYQLHAFADDAHEVITQMGGKPVLVGASLGGMTGIMLEGIRNQGSIRALVLVDIIPRMDRNGADRIKEFMLAKAYSGFATLDEVADAVAAYNPHRPRPRDLDGLKKNLRHRAGRWYWHWDPRFIEMTDAENAREIQNPKLMDQAMAAIDVPVLLVRGRVSDLVTEEGAADFLKRYPDAEFVDVSGAGHMVAGDKNDVFTAAVVDFLDRV